MNVNDAIALLNRHLTAVRQKTTFEGTLGGGRVVVEILDGGDGESPRFAVQATRVRDGRKTYLGRGQTVEEAAKSVDWENLLA